jgi:hypothetical protein
MAIDEYLTDHYERTLGSITRGWSDKKLPGVQIVSFANQPEKCVTTYASLGLSRLIMPLPSGRGIRQEILLSAMDSFAGEEVASALLSIAEQVMSRQTAFVRGEVLEPRRAIVATSKLTSYFITNPSPLPAALIEVKTDPPPLVFVYAIPITRGETDLVRTHGWRWFEDQLVDQNPNIWDLNRVEVVRR